jgi:TonB family protein
MDYKFINGFLGTVILHLLAGIIFFSAKLTGIYTQNVQIKVETPESIKQEKSEKELEEMKKAMIEKMADAFIAAQQRTNIGVNIAGKGPVVMEKDLQQIQEELDAARKQLAGIQDNLENQDKTIRSTTTEGVSTETKKTEKIKGKLAVYKGPTNIYFDLANRNQIDLYVPVYKCQGNGQVVVNITVNRTGEVEDAEIDKQKSDNDDCLSEAAFYAALHSKFNTDLAKAPAKQKGTITYLFVAQ